MKRFQGHEAETVMELKKIYINYKLLMIGHTSEPDESSEVVFCFFCACSGLWAERSMVTGGKGSHL